MLDRPRRLPAASLLIMVPALALGACGSAASQPPAATPAATSGSPTAAPTAAPSRAPVIPDFANALIAVGRTGRPNLEVLEANSGHSFMSLPVGAPDPTWGHLFSTSSDGSG